MILVTAANGAVGSAVVKALALKDLNVRAFVRTIDQRANSGSSVEFVKGDFFNSDSVERALEGVDRVFHIGPPHVAGEFAIGQTMIDCAQGAGVKHFVFLSAIHPLIEALPAHRMKLLVQQYLIDSGMPYTILQPCMFMQNISVQRVRDSGKHAVPYSLDVAMSYVDRQEVAEVAALICSSESHLGATYELVGEERVTGHQIARLIEEQSGRRIEAQEIPASAIVEKMPRGNGEQSYTADTFERMFMYYNRHGLTGNSNVLGWLLGRKPLTFSDYVRREDFPWGLTYQRPPCLGALWTRVLAD